MQSDNEESPSNCCQADPQDTEVEGLDGPFGDTGNPGSAPAALPTLNNTMTTHVNPLYAMLGVQPIRSDLAALFNELPENKRLSPILATLVAVLSRLEGITRMDVDHGLTPSSLLSHSEQVCMFKYSIHVKNLIWKCEKQFLAKEDVEAYAEDNQENSLFRMVMAEICIQPAPFLCKEFPPKFISQDHATVAHVHTEVRLILKQVRHKARNVLLIGIVEGNKPKLPKIPYIVELSRLMCRHLVAGQAAMSNVEVDAKVGPHLQIRFAYLQLETLVNHLLSNPILQFFAVGPD
ncbi:hypothetical protein PCANC_28385 [Puccinia coronata f. sp. avenae]|uniref:Uncharacterized protein n=1 Tax=Puccinia coronata f. sp. avenae TaxID=200324 RepID=A0A2N5S111_9BASI|nr:hypothetical protein PCANC_28385 [Puccinia coronata f. sp. avenae]